MVQRADSTLATVSKQFLPTTTSYGDIPALGQCISKNESDELFFGQTEYFGPQLVTPTLGWPSRAHVWKLDTELNVLGDYVFDGFTDSLYYLLRAVQATVDGGALLSGSVADIRVGAADTRTKAWIAKIAPEDFTAAMPEHEKVRGWMFPNPGTNHLEIMLAGKPTAAPSRSRTCRPTCAPARIVRDQFPHQHAEGMPAGLYAIGPRTIRRKRSFKDLG
ncbi:MAG: hypothetical protein IPP33_14210 [Flavobacteriales bacterium]|nr:hypothetical protein [Flavobacteriales bacterium]